MKISLEWIREYTSVPMIDAEEIARKFTMATCEVEKVISSAPLFGAVVVAVIEGIEDHPNAEALHLAQINTGDERISVVCGATNLEVGMKCVYAPVGTPFSDDFILEEKDIRGVVSRGMLCSERELGLGDDHDGILRLPDDAIPGVSLLRQLGMENDFIFDIDNKSITHRADLWGCYGMAREFSALFGTELRNPFDDNWEKGIEAKFTDDNSPIIPVIKEGTCCLGYSGVSVDDVQISESPEWLKNRLIACGLRPISNIVDVSNYVMLELGIPIHIFDREKVSRSEIVVCLADQDREFITLDEQKRILEGDDTVVADGEKPQVIAGIMGGLDSSVTESTTRIFIESAIWRDSAIHKTSIRLGLRTDSSLRYEKRLDPAMLKRTLYRTLELVLTLSPEARVCGKAHFVGMSLPKEKTVITTSAGSISKLLGKDIPTSEVVKLLESIDFKIDKDGEELKVTVPSYRAVKDVTCEEDIIEEVGRLIGYDTITPLPPVQVVSGAGLTMEQKRIREVRRFLAYRASALEITTYPIVGSKLLNESCWPELNESLVLKNPVSPDHDRMRPSLIPGLLAAVNLNQSRHREEMMRLFEWGRCYHPSESGFSEERNHLAVVFGQKDATPFLEARNAFEKALGLSGNSVAFSPMKKNPVVFEDWEGLHPREKLSIVIDGECVGSLFSIHPLILKDFKIKGRLTIGIADLTEIYKKPLCEPVSFKPISRYPESLFDCTIMVDSRTPAEDLLQPLKTGKIPFFKGVRIVDIYSFSDEKKSVTLRSVFADDAHTLSGNEVRESEDAVVATLARAGFPLKM